MVFVAHTQYEVFAAVLFSFIIKLNEIQIIYFSCDEICTWIERGSVDMGVKYIYIYIKHYKMIAIKILLILAVII